MRDRINARKAIHGDVKLYRVTTGLQGFQIAPHYEKLRPGWLPVTEFMKNEVLYEWGALVGQLLMRRGLNYGIAGMYVEFENAASPGDPVAPPTLTRNADEGVDYYNSLSGSSDRDYLRVPLIA